ncbi:MAG TPA: type IV pilus biogenesis/stability protein PilW [Rhodocyclaceae bacterium]|nr:type IV pilus biogenesis/stability protein PilW [Rhodocyclaceae bacterium]
MKKILLVLLGVMLLSGCVSNGPSSTPMAQPLAQQIPSNEVRKRASIHTELGFAYYEQKNMVAALDEARLSLSIDSSYALAYNLLGLIYLELKEIPQGDEAFQRALSFAPGDPDISNNYGWFLCETNHYAKAMSFFDVAMKNPLYSAPALTMNNAALCASKNGDEAKAEELLQKATRLDPNNTRGILLLAELNYRTGRYGEARLRLMDFHHKSDMTAASAWLGFRIARKTGERMEEARYLSQLRQRFPDSNEMALLNQGRFE